LHAALGHADDRIVDDLRAINAIVESARLRRLLALAAFEIDAVVVDVLDIVVEDFVVLAVNANAAGAGDAAAKDEDAIDVVAAADADRDLAARVAQGIVMNPLEWLSPLKPARMVSQPLLSTGPTSWNRLWSICVC
jgi:hypothetical protein